MLLIFQYLFYQLKYFSLGINYKVNDAYFLSTNLFIKINLLIKIAKEKKTLITDISQLWNSFLRFIIYDKHPNVLSV